MQTPPQGDKKSNQKIQLINSLAVSLLRRQWRLTSEDAHSTWKDGSVEAHDADQETKSRHHGSTKRYTYAYLPLEETRPNCLALGVEHLYFSAHLLNFKAHVSNVSLVAKLPSINHLRTGSCLHTNYEFATCRSVSRLSSKLLQPDSSPRRGVLLQTSRAPQRALSCGTCPCCPSGHPQPECLIPGQYSRPDPLPLCHKNFIL